MSFQFHPNAYESVSAKHRELVAEADLERQLDAAAEERPHLVTRVRIVVGMWLIAAGERISRPAATASHL